MPVHCTLGKTCYIQNYVDHDPTDGFADFTCGPLGYDGHKGTDFALPDLAAMERGVDVLSAAPGVVRAVRDGVPDISIRDPNAPDISGRECGNGLVVSHGGGWETQYCHLKRDSITVTRGQRVRKGSVLGQIGLSGRTEFPHLHLSVRKDGKVVDPFHPTSLITCGDPQARPLWRDPIPYTAGGLIRAGFQSFVPDFEDVKTRNVAAKILPPDAEGLVLWAHFFGVRAGDEIRIDIVGPKGFAFQKSTKATRNRAISFRAAGKKRPGEGWTPGQYFGSVRHIRDGAVMDEKRSQVTITSR